MPMPVLQCALCGRERRQTKLEFDYKIEDDDVVPYYKCKNGCLPTRWEAYRERKHQQKLLSELKSWTENK